MNMYILSNYERVENKINCCRFEDWTVINLQNKKTLNCLWVTIAQHDKTKKTALGNLLGNKKTQIKTKKIELWLI